jgi:hypothetical protein
MQASRSWIIVLGAALAIAALASCNKAGALTQDNLDKIQQDMSSAQVKAILGEPTDSETEPIPIVGGTKTTYTYSDGGAQIVIVFKNDNVVSKEGHFSGS